MATILILYYFGDYFGIALLFIYQNINQNINMCNYTTKCHLYSFYFPNSELFLQVVLLMTFLYIFLEYFSYLFKCKMSLPTKLSWVMYNCRKHIFLKKFVIFFSCFINAINSDKETETDSNLFL